MSITPTHPGFKFRVGLTFDPPLRIEERSGRVSLITSTSVEVVGGKIVSRGLHGRGKVVLKKDGTVGERVASMVLLPSSTPGIREAVAAAYAEAYAALPSTLEV